MNIPVVQSKPAGPVPIQVDQEHRRKTFACLALAFLTFWLYLPSLEHGFVNYDDEAFLTHNDKVGPGFTWEGIKWAFTSADIDYWRPLSWLSHMLDAELFGPVAGAHHLTNVVLHCAAAVMLFLAMLRLTAAHWPSFVVAALFAWHPFHVESVAWIAERKDMLVGFFWFFTMWAYARYAAAPGWKNYLWVLGGFLMGLMSKPMIVTLPCALLLLDFWPLRRWVPGGVGPVAGGERRPFAPASLGRLVLEKVPLFLIVALTMFLVYKAQKDVGAMGSGEGIPLTVRVANAAVAYATYFLKSVVPTDLTLLYPYKPIIPAWKWGGAVALLVLSSALAVWQWRRRPYLFTGWFWFIGTLVPVIGIVQVGEQAMADRYTYIPLTGLFICAAWGLARWLPASRWSSQALIAAVLVVFMSGARQQVHHWEDSTTIFGRTVLLTEKNSTAYNNLSAALLEQGRSRDAVRCLREGLSFAPHAQHLNFNMGAAQHSLGDYIQARHHYALGFRAGANTKVAIRAASNYRDTLKQDPDSVPHRFYLADALVADGKLAAAVAEMDEVLRAKPEHLDARLDRAAYLAKLDREDEALADLHSILQRQPDHELANSNLGGLLLRRGRTQESIQLFQTALRTNPRNSLTHYNLGLAWERAGDPKAALGSYAAMLDLDPKDVLAGQRIAWLLATDAKVMDAEFALQTARRTIQITTRRTPALIDTFAAALAASGKFKEAIAVADEAIALARDKEPPGFIAEMEARRQLYLQGKAYVRPAAGP